MVAILWDRKSPLDNETITVACTVFNTVPLSPQQGYCSLRCHSCVYSGEHACLRFLNVSFHVPGIAKLNRVLKCGARPSFTGSAGYSSAIFYTPNQGKLPVLERKQQPLRRLKIMKISLSAQESGHSRAAGHLATSA